MVTTVTRYRTADGKLFDTELVAVKHESFSAGFSTGLKFAIDRLEQWGLESGGGEGRTDTIFHSHANMLREAFSREGKL